MSSFFAHVRTGVHSACKLLSSVVLIAVLCLHRVAALDVGRSWMSSSRHRLLHENTRALADLAHPDFFVLLSFPWLPVVLRT